MGVAAIIGGVIQGGFSLWSANKQEKATKAANEMYGQQYAQETATKTAQQKWQNKFMQDKEAFGEHQENLKDFSSWGKDMEAKVNSDVGLKNNLISIWQNQRRA